MTSERQVERGRKPQVDVTEGVGEVIVKWWERCIFKLLPTRETRCQNSSKMKECMSVCVCYTIKLYMCGYLAALCECVCVSVFLSMCVSLSGCDTDPCGVAGLTALMSRIPSRARRREGHGASQDDKEIKKQTPFLIHLHSLTSHYHFKPNLVVSNFSSIKQCEHKIPIRPTACKTLCDWLIVLPCSQVNTAFSMTILNSLAT